MTRSNFSIFARVALVLILWVSLLRNHTVRSIICDTGYHVSSTSKQMRQMYKTNCSLPQACVQGDAYFFLGENIVNVSVGDCLARETCHLQSCASLRKAVRDGKFYQTNQTISVIHCNISCCSDEQCYATKVTWDMTERPQGKANLNPRQENIKSSSESSKEHFKSSATMSLNKNDSARATDEENTWNSTKNMTFIFVNHSMTTVMHNTVQASEVMNNISTENASYSTEISGEYSGRFENEMLSTTQQQLHIVIETKSSRALPRNEKSQLRNDSRLTAYDRLLISMLLVFTIAVYFNIFLS